MYTPVFSLNSLGIHFGHVAPPCRIFKSLNTYGSAPATLPLLCRPPALSGQDGRSPSHLHAVRAFTHCSRIHNKHEDKVTRAWSEVRVRHSQLVANPAPAALNSPAPRLPSLDRFARMAPSPCPPPLQWPHLPERTWVAVRTSIAHTRAAPVDWSSCLESRQGRDIYLVGLWCVHDGPGGCAWDAVAADGGDPGGLADQALLLPWEQRSRNRWVQPNAALLSHVHMYVHAVDFFKYGGSRLLLGWVPRTRF